MIRVRSTGFSRNPGEEPPKGGTTNGAFLAACGIAVTLIVVGLVPCGFAVAIDGPMGVERVAPQFSPQYQSKPAKSDGESRWVQVDLGQTRKIDAVKLLPMTVPWSGDSEGFPVRFKIEVSGDPAFKTAILTTDRLGVDYPDPKDAVGIFPSGGAKGRYVRLTATQLRQKQLALTKLEVISEGQDVAVGCPAADSESGNLGVTVLTRPVRPQGEGVVTDNPGNVIPVAQWQPVRYAAETPLRGVRIQDGLFKQTMENNVRYLLDSFTVDEMLQAFRQRAGRPMPPLSRPLDPFWFGELPGSAAGRFLMGAGNTLRWMDNAELRRRLNEIVDGIADCRRPDGYIMAYNEDTIFTGERAAYTRAWVTHGLIEAGLAGNAKAWSLLRGYYDWYDRCPYLPEVMRRGHQGIQGMIANARMYFTPVGRPEDLQVIQRYFQENYWLDQMAAREDRAIWMYPYDRPHCYLLTSIEPYLDLYRATGAKNIWTPCWAPGNCTTTSGSTSVGPSPSVKTRLPIRQNPIVCTATRASSAAASSGPSSASGCTCSSPRKRNMSTKSKNRSTTSPSPTSAAERAFATPPGSWDTKTVPPSSHTATTPAAKGRGPGCSARCRNTSIPSPRTASTWICSPPRPLSGNRRANRSS